MICPSLVFSLWCEHFVLFREILCTKFRHVSRCCITSVCIVCIQQPSLLLANSPFAARVHRSVVGSCASNWQNVVRRNCIACLNRIHRASSVYVQRCLCACCILYSHKCSQWLLEHISALTGDVSATFDCSAPAGSISMVILCSRLLVCCGVNLNDHNVIIDSAKQTKCTTDYSCLHIIYDSCRRARAITSVHG